MCRARRGRARIGRRQRKETLRVSPSFSSSSSSSKHKNTAPEKLNSRDTVQILCQQNGWSGKSMILALQEAIDFKATEMPEATLEQVGEWLVTAYFKRRESKGEFAGGPQKFFEQALYRTSTILSGNSATAIPSND